MTARPAHPRLALGRILSTLVIVVAFGHARAQTGTATSTGVSGDWTSAAVWTTSPNTGFFPNNGVDGRNWNAIINSGTINLDSPITIEQLTFNGGTITGANSLTMNGLTTWTGGTFSGAGGTFLNGGARISGATSKAIFRAVTLGGTTSTWSGADIFMGFGATLTNSASSTFTVTIDSSIFNAGGATSTFNNAGTFVKNGGTGVTSVQAAFNNTGSVSVQTGTLSLSGGGTSTGSFTVAGTLDFAAGTHAISGPVSGAGTGRFSSGTTTMTSNYNLSATEVAGGTVNFNAAASSTTLALSAGTLAGSAPVTVSGLTTWSGGGFAGAGTTALNSGATISGAVNKAINSRSVTLGGTTSTWSGGEMFLGFGATLTNSLGSTFTITGDNSISFAGGATSTFNNAGTFVKNGGAGVTSLQVVFNNTGSVSVQTGTLLLSGGSTSSGSFAVAGTLDFGAGTHDISGPVSGTGTGRFSSGTTTMTGSYNLPAMEVAGATVNFNTTTAVAPGTLALSAGTLAGSAAVTVSGLTTWTGGSFGGAGATVLNGGVTLPGAVNKGIFTRTVTIGGTTSTWSGGDIFLGFGATLTNALGSTFTATGDNSFNNSGGAPSTFVNDGTFRKQGSAGTTTLNSINVLTNSGTVDVQSGTLAINSLLTNTGVVTTALGTTVTGSVTSNSGGIVRGVGTFGGPLLFNSGSTLHPGLSPGILTITGAVTMTSNSAFSTELNGTTAGTGYGQLLLSGANATINLGDSTLSATLGYMPNGTDALTIISGGTITGTFANAPAGVPFLVGSFGGQPYNAFVLYSSNSVVLTNFAAVPEPTFILTAAGALGLTAWWRRRRVLKRRQCRNGE